MHSLSPSTLAAVAGITALVGAFKGLTGSLKGVLDNFAHFESMQKGLETFFHDADKGKEKFEELRKLSNETTFGVDELANSFTQLANVGVNVDSINDKLMMLGDISGGDKNKFADLVSIYSKINATGKAGAMQIQQLAMRGVPIYDMLKKMGIQGTATADDITKAFQNMTSEIDETTGKAGQFYNAMNDINDTIVGKEGFISDYFKELTVNFAEVTGLADAYKGILDMLRGVIGSVSDKLLELNNNSLMKAIITGAFTAVLVGLVTVIGVSLVGALQTLIVKMGILVALKTALTGPVGMIALGVAGLGALVAGFASFSKSVEQAEKDQEALNKKLREAQDLAHQGSNPVSDSRNNQLEQAQKDLDVYTKAKGKATAELKKAEKALADYDRQIAEYEKSWNAESGITKEQWIKDNLWASSLSEGTDNKSREDIVAEVERWKGSIESANTLIDQTQSKVSKIKTEISTFGDTDALKEVFDELWKTVGKGESELEDLQGKLKQVQMYKAQDGKYNNAGQLIKFDDKERSEIDKTVNYLQRKIDDVTLDLKLADMEDWQKDLQKALGFDKKTTASLIGKSGDEWIKKYKTIQSEQSSRVDATNKALGINKNNDPKTLISEQAKGMMSLIQNLHTKSSEKFGLQANGELDNTFTELKEELDSLKEKYIEQGGTLEDWEVLMNNAKESTKEGMSISQFFQHQKGEGAGTYFGKAMGQQLLANSGDASNFAQGFKQGGVIGGVIETLIGAFMNVAKEMDNFDKVMNPITNMFKVLRPTIRTIFNILERGVDVLPLIGTIINKIVTLLEPILNIITDLVVDFIEDLYVGLQILTPLLNILKMVFNAIRVLLIPFRLLQAAITGLINLLKSIPFIKKLVDGIEDASKKLETAVDEVCGDINIQTKNLRGVLEDEQKAIEATKDNEEKAVKDLTSEYKALLDAMKQNEEWYLTEKTRLNADTRKNAYSVNDMILTPEGQFSTHPDDYIIATKNPQALGGAVFNMKIENNVANDVDVSATSTPNENGGQDILVMISRKIAQDVANGANGWDSARASQNARLAGRMVQL